MSAIFTTAIVGRTIKKAVMMKNPKYDDEGYLRLEFTDGTYCTIIGGYSGYTGESEDEYPTAIGISSKPHGELVPVGEIQ